MGNENILEQIIKINKNADELLASAAVVRAENEREAESEKKQMLESFAEKSAARLSKHEQIIKSEAEEKLTEIEREKTEKIAELEAEFASSSAEKAREIALQVTAL